MRRLPQVQAKAVHHEDGALILFLGSMVISVIASATLMVVCLFIG